MTAALLHTASPADRTSTISACSRPPTLLESGRFARSGFPTTPATRCASSLRRGGRPSRSWNAGRPGGRTTDPNGPVRRSRGSATSVRRGSGRSTTAGTRGAGSATRCSARLVGSPSSWTRSTAIRFASSGADQPRGTVAAGSLGTGATSPGQCRSRIADEKTAAAVVAAAGLAQLRRGKRLLAQHHPPVSQARNRLFGQDRGDVHDQVSLLVGALGNCLRPRRVSDRTSVLAGSRRTLPSRGRTRATRRIAGPRAPRP